MYNLKRIIIFVMFVFMVLTINAEPFIVVIDAGHGGKDVGAVGRQKREKDINLAVALKLGDMIESSMNDVKVVYTRKTDKYLTLQERADIANKFKGNLFISIHTNSVSKKNKNRNTIKGASTYTLGLHRSEDNLEVAMRENSVISLETDYEVTYQGFDPNSTESYIIFEISQNAHMEQSVDFASRVQSEFVTTASRVDRGVRQAGFLVLARTSMPAVLVELDFICNPTQETFLGSTTGQTKLAKSIYNAFYDYKISTDNKIAAVSGKKPLSESKMRNNVKPINSENELNTDDVIKEDNIRYKIQVLTSKVRLQKNDYRLKGLSPVDYYIENGLYKYTYASAKTMEEAQSILKVVRKSFKEAFIVTFNNGKRVK